MANKGPLERGVVAMMYRISFEFRLTRLVPWTDDGIDFYSHVEAVRDKVEAHEAVYGVRVVTNRTESSLTFDFTIEAARHQLAEEFALEVVGAAIESAGARHFGMSPLGPSLTTSAGANSGMDTPVWHRRRILVGVAA